MCEGAGEEPSLCPCRGLQLITWSPEKCCEQQEIMLLTETWLSHRASHEQQKMEAFLRVSGCGNRQTGTGATEEGTQLNLRAQRVGLQSRHMFARQWKLLNNHKFSILRKNWELTEESYWIDYEFTWDTEFISMWQNGNKVGNLIIQLYFQFLFYTGGLPL